MIWRSVVAGRALQLAAQNVAGFPDTSLQAQPVDVVYARAICRALDPYVNHAMTIDERDNLQDQLCPTLSTRRPVV
jgi:hypothetical protein